MYKLTYDPADQEGTGSPAESLIFSPNPVLSGQSAVLDAGEDVFLSRIRITDAGGRSIHDAQFYWVSISLHMEHKWHESGDLYCRSMGRIKRNTHPWKAHCPGSVAKAQEQAELSAMSSLNTA